MKLFSFLVLASFLFNMSTIQANEINFEDLGLVADLSATVDPATEEDENFFVGEVLADREAIHYQTPAMDVYIYRDFVSFNGKRYEWKQKEKFIGLFVNTYESTNGTYASGKNPFIKVIDKDNIVSISSSNKKYAVEFHSDFIRVNEKNRAWLLIIPFPENETNSFIELDSMEEMEKHIPEILNNLVENQLDIFDFNKLLIRQIKPDQGVIDSVENGSFDFETSFAAAIRKKKKIYETAERDKVMFSFYLGCKDTLDFELVKKVKKSIYTTALRDFVIFDWALGQTFTIDQLKATKRQLYQTECRDALIMGYVEQHRDSLTNDELNTLRKECYITKNRDSIALMIND